MIASKHPYEFLVRWDQDGKLVGAHIQYRYVTRAGVDVIGEFLGPAISVTLKGEDGAFPLSEILSDIERGALAKVTKVEQEKAEMLDEIVKLQNNLYASAKIKEV